jgi:hypothetical protein
MRRAWVRGQKYTHLVLTPLSVFVSPSQIPVEDGGRGGRRGGKERGGGEEKEERREEKKKKKGFFKVSL